MEVGQYAEINNLAIIQARMTSSRLPGKVLLPLPFPDGSPLIYRIIQKLQLSQRIDKIVVVLPFGSSQISLVSFLQSEKIIFIEGDEENVLSRFIKAVQIFKPKSVVRITADNPFIDVIKLDEFISGFESAEEDYWYSTYLPYGMNMEIFSAKALLAMGDLKNLSADDKEHVTSGFLDDNLFKSKSIQLNPVDLGYLRVTVDDVQDYMRAALLYQLQNGQRMDNDLRFIIEANQNYPYLFTNNI